MPGLSKTHPFSFLIAILALTILACSVFLPKPAPTMTAASTSTKEQIPGFTPTISNSPLPPITLSPRPTGTSTPQPEWVTDFAQPILDAIADRAPDFQDDFLQASPDWQREMMNCKDEGCVISNGVLKLKTVPENGEASWAIMTIPCYLEFRTFVLRVDVNTGELHRESAAGIGYDNDGYKFSFEIKDKGRWWYLGESGSGGWDSGQLPIPAPKIITFTIMVRDTKLAVYLNDTPVTLREFAAVMNKTGLTLRAWSDGTTTAIVEYDNLKIWNLDDVPNLP